MAFFDLVVSMLHSHITEEEGHSNLMANDLLQLLNEQLTVTSMQPVLCPRASELIAEYDEHVLVSNFKFGVLYQRFGQTSEEQLFSNKHSSPAFNEFLNLLGQKIQLKDHKG